MKDIFENINIRTLIISAAVLLLSIALIVGIVLIVALPDGDAEESKGADETKTEESGDTEPDDSRIDVTPSRTASPARSNASPVIRPAICIFLI